MAVFGLLKWAKFNTITRHGNLCQNFLARTQLFTRQSITSPAQQEVVTPSQSHGKLWLVYADCEFYDSTPTTVPCLPSSVHVPPDESTAPIATQRQFSLDAPAVLNDITGARPLIPTERNVKTGDGGQPISGLVDCVATLDFVPKNLVQRYSLPPRKSKVQTPAALVNGQCAASSTVCDISIELARHEFQRTFCVLRDLRATGMALGLPWLDDEQALYILARPMFSP
jgi:hypothetical protein